MASGGNKIKDTLQKLMVIFNDFTKKQQDIEKQSKQIVQRARQQAANTDQKKIAELKNKIKTT